MVVATGFDLMLWFVAKERLLIHSFLLLYLQTTSHSSVPSVTCWLCLHFADERGCACPPNFSLSVCHKMHLLARGLTNKSEFWLFRRKRLGKYSTNQNNSKSSHQNNFNGQLFCKHLGAHGWYYRNENSNGWVGRSRQDYHSLQAQAG